MTMDNELLEVFRAEVGEQIGQLRTELQRDPAGWDLDILFRLSHNIKGAARMVDAKGVRDVAHALEDVFAAVREGAVPAEAATGLVRPGCDLLGESFAGLEDGREVDWAPFREHVDRFLAGETTGTYAAAQAQSAGGGGGGAADRTLRIAIDKLDRLLEYSNELVTAGYRMEERISQTNALQNALHGQGREKLGSESAGFLRALEQAVQQMRRDLVKDRAHFTQVSGQVREAVRLLRMVRVDSLRTLFTRVVQEAAEKTGKLVELRITGGETELDRSVLEGLRDPLVHLLRNAIAHGIELPEERAAARKPAAATLTLSARLHGGTVELDVSDDGAGLRWGRIRSIAVERGLANADEAAGWSESELSELLFQSGFSTAATADELAGRGVGLDVVRQNVQRLGGSVMVRSVDGRGASFRLHVPLTRLTTKGVLVKLGGHFLAAPIMSVAQTLLVAPHAVQEADGGHVVDVNGRPVPLHRMEDVLGLPSQAQGTRPAVVLTEGDRQAAFLVDEVHGEKDYLLQPLSWNLRAVKGVSGGAVLDGGRICLVLDAVALLGSRSDAGRAAWRQGSAEEARRKRILIVDDSVTTRTLEKNILTAAGYGINLALDGEDAWQKLHEGEYDLVISDVEMPRLNGLDLTRRIRGDARFKALPIILVTSLGNEAHKLAGAEAGADAYIVKGAFDQDQLLGAVARLL